MSEFTSEEQRDLYNSITDIKSNIARMLFMLESDGRTNSKGLVEKVEELTKEVGDLKRKETILQTKIVTTTFVVFLFVSFISWTAKLLYNQFIAE